MKKLKLFTLATAALLVATGCGNTGTTSGEQTSTPETDSVEQTSTDTLTQAATPAADPAAAASQEAKKETTADAFDLKTLIDAVYAQKRTIFDFKKASAQTVMENLGFTFEGSSNSSIKNDYDETVAVVKMTFKRGDETALVVVRREFDGLEYINITFADSEAAKAFVASSRQSLGKKLKSEYGGYTYTKGVDSWFMEQKGKTVKINLYEKMD